MKSHSKQQYQCCSSGGSRTTAHLFVSKQTLDEFACGSSSDEIHLNLKLVHAHHNHNNDEGVCILLPKLLKAGCDLSNDSLVQVLVLSKSTLCVEAHESSKASHACIIIVMDVTQIKHIISCCYQVVTIIYDEQEFVHSIILRQEMYLLGNSESNHDSVSFSRCSMETFILQQYSDCVLYKSPYSTLFLQNLHAFHSKVWKPLGVNYLAVIQELDGTSQKLQRICGSKDKMCLEAYQLRNNIVTAQCFLNVFLGLIALVILYYNSYWIATQVCNNTEVVVKSTTQLLDWMKGVPAGLKLNHKMTVFLGKFFSYHVWLWAEYLRLVGQHFEPALHVIGLAGIAGLSVQISLLQDLLLFLTLHMYCFYIYSARLYSIVITSLLSLWRLFRGKKWNVLRKRVDHGSYDITQLFIGTLLFSILLFLLPTVTLYYAVFSTFRLSLVATQLILEQLKNAVHHQYVVIYYLLLINSRYIKDKYKIMVIDNHGRNQTIIEIVKITSASYRKCCEVLKLPADDHRMDIKTVLRNLISGTII